MLIMYAYTKYGFLCKLIIVCTNNNVYYDSSTFTLGVPLLYAETVPHW